MYTHDNYSSILQTRYMATFSFNLTSQHTQPHPGVPHRRIKYYAHTRQIHGGHPAPTLGFSHAKQLPSLRMVQLGYNDRGPSIEGRRRDIDRGAKTGIAEEIFEVSKVNCQLQSIIIQNSQRIVERKDVGVGVGVGVVACLPAGLKNIQRSSCAASPQCTFDSIP
jgi:hypothetical protein